MAENTEEKSEEKKAEEEIPSFKDFAERKVLTGSKVSLNSILNKELIILSFEKGASKMDGWAKHACTYNFRIKADFGSLYGTKAA